MVCQLCERLRSELKSREREHAMAAQCFSAVTEANEAVVFRKFRTKLSDARLEYELARLTLEKHQQDGHAGTK